MPKLSEMTTLPVLENSSVYDSTIWEKMAGGDIETNLLERSRGTYQSPCKRDYPIFYFKEIDLNDS